MEKFKELKLSEGMLQAIKNAGFSEPSEIQQKTIPLVLAGKDVIGSSATGSGKTLAFGAGIIDKIKRGSGMQTLVLTPTRELAEQVSHTLKSFSRNQGLNVMGVYGGVSMGPQVRDLRHADLVVGTPGRILDHIRRRSINLTRIKFLVLDEADRMLDMGFIKDVESIIKFCPKERQTLLFSATMSKDIDYIAQKYMKNPVNVSAISQVDASKLYQIYYDVPHHLKFSLLAFLLKREKQGFVMVFCNTRRNVDRLTDNLKAHNIHALSIHGGLSQNKRNYVIQSFHSRKALILVCTDVAARGLDIKDVSHVYNYDLPQGGNDYIHRIGRTARAGKNGIAISFVSEGDHGIFRQIAKEASLKVEKEALPQFEALQVRSQTSSSEDRRRTRRNFGRSGSRGGFRGKNVRFRRR